MTRLLRNPRGLTIVELLVAAVILSFVMAATVAVHIMSLRMYRDSQAEALLFTEGLYALEMIQRGDSGLHGLMKGRSDTVVINADQDRIDFLADQNADYTETLADDVAMAMYFDNGDGDDATLEDNSITVESGADTFAVGTNVENVAFTQNGDMVTVDITVAERVRGRTHRLTLSRDVMMRN
jgi:prepilin-type N-terminal cleavage/methylation domain-containing protein